MVLMSVLDCKVLDHLINNVAPSLVNKTSALANCLVGSKDSSIWGNKLEILKKEKNATNSNVLYTNESGKASHSEIKEVKRSMSM